MEAEMDGCSMKSRRQTDIRKPPEYRPPAPPSVAPELKGQEQKLPSDAAQPPTSLSREAREHWASLPEPVQKFIAEREMQAQQKISELGEYAKVAREITQVFEQFSETMPKLADGQAAPPSQVMQHLLAANDALGTQSARGASVARAIIRC